MRSKPLTKKVTFSIARADDVGQYGKGHLNARAFPRGLALFGWVVGHDAAIDEIEVLADGSRLTLAPVDLERPDVEAMHANLARAGRSGFRIVLEASRAGVSELQVRVICDEQRMDLASVEVEVGLPWWQKLTPTHLLSGERREAPIEWTVLSPPKEREKVLLGKEGWLFLRRDSNDVIGQQAGDVRLTTKQRRAWKGVLRSRVEMAARIGAHWQCLVIPDKEFLYSEYLPDDVTPARRRPVHDILDLASAVKAPVGYLLADLEAAKPGGELFPKTDTHWNQRGSYVAYRAFCGRLRDAGIAVPEIQEEEIRWIPAEAPGGLGLKLYPQARSDTVRADLVDHRSNLVFDNRVHNHGRVMVFEQDRRTGLSAVIFGESFVQNLLIFLKESFDRLTFAHTSMMVDGILRRENPDVVLSAPLERFLMKVPEDANAFERLLGEATEKLANGRLSPGEEPFLRHVPRRLDRSDESTGVFPWLGVTE